MTVSVVPLDIYRRVFAEEVGAVANLQTPGLVDAIATVAREHFLGDGPWKVFRSDSIPGSPGSYSDTPTADPRHVCHNVLVALDAARGINNGQPSLITSWIDALRLSSGEHVVHIGCGTGYYSAIMAAVVDRIGAVTAIESDAALAERARRTLAAYPTVHVVEGDGVSAAVEKADAILVNAGVSMFPAAWLDGLRDSGRLLLPLTFSPTAEAIGTGVAVIISRHKDAYAARLIGVTQIYSCVGARDSEGNGAIQRALARGRWREVKKLRRDAHEAGDMCWCHLASGCLSM